jgi:hypothetical protein
MREGQLATSVAQHRPKVAPVAAEGTTAALPSVPSIVMAAAMAGKVVATRRYDLRTTANMAGGRVLPPEHGAKGIAGLRADIGDGSLSIRDLERMTIRELQDRYRVSRPVAWRMRRHVLAYGLGGRCRLPGGRVRPVPLPRLGPVTDPRA